MKKRLLKKVGLGVILVVFAFSVAGCGNSKNTERKLRQLSSDVKYYKEENSDLKKENTNLKNELKETKKEEAEEKEDLEEDYVDIRFPVDGKQYKAEGSKFYEDRYCSLEIKEPITLISKGNDYFQIDNGNWVYVVRSDRGLIYTNESPYIEEITVD